jgi:hypothetical protein
VGVATTYPSWSPKWLPESLLCWEWLAIARAFPMWRMVALQPGESGDFSRPKTLLVRDGFGEDGLSRLELQFPARPCVAVPSNPGPSDRIKHQQ